MMLVVAALILWLGFNFAVVFADLALLARDHRDARQAAAVPGGRLAALRHPRLHRH